MLKDGKAQRLTWLKDTINRVGSKIKNGVKFFVDHGKNTNSHADRKAVGEVVGSFVKNISDKLSNVVIGYFKDETLAEKMDVCSMEADVSIDETNNVVDLNELTGIALGSSSENSPAFQGAVRLASLQCFDNDANNNTPEGNKGGHEMPTFDEVKQFIRDRNVWPSQLFDTDTVRKDREFANIFDEHEKLTKENKELTDANEKITKESAAALKLSQTQTAKERFKELLPEGLTKKQEAYIDKKFDPEKMDDISDKGITDFINKSKEDFAELAPIFSEDKKEDLSDTGKTNNDTLTGDAVEDALTALVGE